MKISMYFFAMLTCISFTVNAQSPSILWQRSFGGSAQDWLWSTIRTNDGGYISAGNSNSVDGDVTGNHGLADDWIVKQDSNGNIEWQRSYGGSGNDNPVSIQQTNDGGYIVAGQSNSNDGDVSGNHGDNDYWVIKLDAAGNIQWQRSFGGSQFDAAYSIKQTSDFGFIMVGYSTSTDGDVTGNHGSGDCWVVKIDSLGNIEWQKSLGGSGDDWGNSIFETTDHGYLLSGGTNSNDGDVSGTHGGNDYWVVKIDSVGNIQWQRALGGSAGDVQNGLALTSDGGSIVAGYTYSNDGDVTGFHGVSDSSDTWLVKLDSLGNIQWEKAYGGTADDWANAIQETSNHEYIVAGQSNSNNGDLLNNPSNNGSYDSWIMQLDNSGNIEWQKMLGGSDDDGARSIEQTNDGFIIGGHSKSSDGDVTVNHGDYDYWVVKLVNPSSSSTAVTICSADLPYTWNATVFNAAGNYIVHLTNAAGGDSAATLILTVRTFTVDTIAGPKNSCLFTGPLGGNATYSVAATGAISYLWTVPASSTLVSGQGTNTITVHYQPTYHTGYVRVTVTSDCAGLFRTNMDNILIQQVSSKTRVDSTQTSGTTPPPTSSISGVTNSCPASRAGRTPTPVTYSIVPLPAGTVLFYHWTIPAHVSLVSAATDSSSITVLFDTTYSTGVFKVRSVSGCGSSIDKTLTVTSTPPLTPGAISGPSNACLYIGTLNTATYTIRKVANATFYIWTVPPGATIVSHPGGEGTANDTIINVMFSAGFGSLTAGNNTSSSATSNSSSATDVTVKSGADCGTSTGTKSFFVGKQLPANPGAVSGTTDVCAYMMSAGNPSGSPVTYSITRVANATSYVWKVPSGSTVTHPEGLGTANDTLVKIIFGSSLIKDSVFVKGVNGCGAGSTRFIVVSRLLPATPGTITGPTDPCPYAFAGNNATYSIRKVLGTAPATSYEWGLTDLVNSHIISHPAGLGNANDTVVTIHFDAAFTTGSVFVKALRDCGESAAKTLSLTKKIPATPTISGNPAPCPLAFATYVANSVTGSTYTWTVPTAVGTFTGQGTPVIQIHFKSTFTSGTISVKALSVCGTSAAKTFGVTKCSIIVITTKGEFDKNSPDAAINPDKPGLLIYPNPSAGDFVITLNNTGNRQLTGDAVINIVNDFGQLVYHTVVKNCNGAVSLKIMNKFPTGVYMVNCVVNGQNINKKLVIDR